MIKKTDESFYTGGMNRAALPHLRQFTLIQKCF